MNTGYSVTDILKDAHEPFRRFMVAGEPPAGTYSQFIPESEILCVAPNIVEFAVGDKWLGNPSTYKHSRQYQVLRDFFQIRCPICNSLDPTAIDCWGKGREYFESEVLLVWSGRHQDEICPKCGITKRELLDDGIFKPYESLVGCAGMRSGKSVTAAIIGTYIEHRILTWPEPIQKTLEVIDNQDLIISFVASSGEQARETVWSAYKRLRLSSPWFVNYANWIKSREKAQLVGMGQKPWRYNEGEEEIEHGFLKVYINSLTSNAFGVAGRTRIAAFIDELSRFEITDSKRSANEMYRVLDQSLQTVRAARHLNALPQWLGLMISISSPISVEDKTMELLRYAPKSQTMFTFHYATWDFNPFQPRELFAEVYQRDPVGAERDFGANPPLTENPLVDDLPRFEKTIDPTARPTAEFRDIMPRGALKRESVGKEVIWCALDAQNAHYLFFDAGTSFDSFAGASVHGEWVDIQDEASGAVTRSMVAVLDWAMSIRPTITPKRTVFYECMVRMVDVISKRQRIGGGGFDRWNSESLMQAIRNLQIPAEQRSLKYADFQSFVGQAYLGRLKLLPRLPSDSNADPRTMSDQAKVIYELSKLQKSIDLKKVYNPKKGQVQGYNSDDLAYVAVGAHSLLLQSLVHKNNTGLSERLRREQSHQSVGTWVGQQSIAIPGAGMIQVGPRPPEDGYSIGPDQPGRIGMKNTIGAVGRLKRW